MAGVEAKPGGVEHGNEEPIGPFVENPSFEQTKNCPRWGGFVAVDSGRKVDARAHAGDTFGESDQRHIIDHAKLLDAKSAFFCCCTGSVDEFGGIE